MKSVDKCVKNESTGRLKNGLNLKINIKAAKKAQSRLGFASPHSPLTLNLALKKDRSSDESCSFDLENDINISPSSSETGSNEGFGHQRLIRRSSFICSTGKDKYSFDSETIAMPLRSIDAYEKQLSLQSTNSSSPSSTFGGFNRTISKMSSLTKYSDCNHSQKNASKSLDNFSTALKFKCKRKSIVQSAHPEPSKSVMINGRFQNPWDTWVPIRFTNILKFGLSKGKSNLPKKEVSDHCQWLDSK